DAVLSPAEADVAKRVYGLLEEPNFEDPHGGGKAWHLQRVAAPAPGGEGDRGESSRSDSGSSERDHAGESNRYESDRAESDRAESNRAEADRTASLLESARRKLRDARDRRVRPGRDEKILAGWNGLAIRGLARAARRLDRADL